jgi:hypothetical protein
VGKLTSYGMSIAVNSLLIIMLLAMRPPGGPANQGVQPAKLTVYVGYEGVVHKVCVCTTSC